MIIVNEDIQLKPIVLDLSMNIFNLIEKNRNYLSKTLAFIKYIKTVDDEINFIKSRNKNFIDTFVIFYNNNIVGMIDIHNHNKIENSLDIGYWLSEEYQGNGIITNSCLKLIDYAFDQLKIDVLNIKVLPNNSKSENIAKRLNFTFINEIIENGTTFKLYQLNQNIWKKNYMLDKIKEFQKIAKEKEEKNKRDEENINVRRQSYKVTQNEELNENKNMESVKTFFNKENNNLNFFQNSKENSIKIDDKIKLDDFKFDEKTKAKIENITQKVTQEKEKQKDTDSCVLLEGSIEFMGKLIAFKVSKINGQIIITSSIIRNGEVLASKTDDFNQVNDEKWQLDTNKTSSDVDIFIEEKSDILSLGNDDMKLVFDKKTKNLKLESSVDVQLNKYSTIRETEQGIPQVNLDCDSLIEKNMINKVILKPIMKNMCESYERKIYERYNKKNINSVETQKEIIKTKKNILTN